MVRIVLLIVLAPFEAVAYTCDCKYPTDRLLHMQISSQADVAGLLRRLVGQELPSGSGLDAWDAFLRAHATLMRRLDLDLAQATGLTLGVVVALTDAGVARLTETAPVHLRGVSELFVAQLDDQELAVLKNALKKVTVDCTFG